MDNKKAELEQLRRRGTMQCRHCKNETPGEVIMRTSRITEGNYITQPECASIIECWERQDTQLGLTGTYAQELVANQGG